MKPPKAALPFLLVGMTAVLFLVSLGLGPVALGPSQIIAGLLGATPDETVRLIVQEIRLPRALLAVIIGAALGLAGAALQGLTRNPLADPSLFGAPQSAAFASVSLVSFAGADVLSFSVPVAGIIGAFVSVFLLIVIAGRNAPMIIVILAGLAISSLAGAATALAMNLAPNFYAALEIAFWLLGSLEDRSMRHVALALPFIAAGSALLLLQARRLRAMTAGDDVAESLGVPVARVRLEVIIGVALATGAAVAVAGAIGFIGLVAPHLVRPMVGHDPGRTLPLAGLCGASLLLAADALVKLAPPTSDLKVGVLTALVGAPFFLVLIIRERRLLAGEAS